MTRMLSNTIILDVLIAITQVVGVCILLLLARGALWLTTMVFIMPHSDPLRMLPGPQGTMMQNHFREVMDPNYSPDTHEEWQKKFGKTFKFHGFGKHDYRLMSFDFRVLSHILNSTTYEKPWQTRVFLARLIGRGIFSMEGAEHKLQRRLIGPAFTTQSVREIVPIFFQKAQQMCDRWKDLITVPLGDTEIHPIGLPPICTPAASSPEKSEGKVIDVTHWISRASFDVIGLAGFDYCFNSLEDESEEVYKAYRRMFDVADKGPRMKGVLELYFPVLRKLWPDDGTRTIDESLRVISKAGQKLVAAKKAAVLVEASNTHESPQRDILSLLIKANVLNDPSQRLSDTELLDQCSTLLLAGSDSVSLALSWCLLYLSQNLDIQARLRDELLSISATQTHSRDVFDSNNFSNYHWDEIEVLPYLDAVIRETLRICPPVHSTIRVATVDDQIPISHPVVLRDGTTIDKDGHIAIRKGSYIHIPIEGLNLSKDIWGSDALQFNPDRWTSLSRGASSPAHPGLGNMMTFGLGPHSCLGYKFSVSELKAFLATILPQFSFTPVEGIEITKFNAILTRPYVMDKWEQGMQLPIAVSKYTG